MDTGTENYQICYNYSLEFASHLQALPSAKATVPDLSQEFSPSKLQHRDSISLHDSFDSTQASAEACHADSDSDSIKINKKPIFKVIRESKVSQ